MGTHNLEASLANHPRAYAEAVTRGTEPLGAGGTPPSGSPGLTQSNPALEQPTAVEQTSEGKQGGSITVPPGAPTEDGERHILAQDGVTGPGAGTVPSCRDPNAEGLVCAQKGGEAASCLFCYSSRYFWRVFQAIPLSLVPRAFSPACPSFHDFKRKWCLVLLSL